MSKIIYDPTGIFEQNESKGGVCEIKQANLSLPALSLNTDFIAGVAGKKIILLSLIARANTATTQFAAATFGLGVVFPAVAVFNETHVWQDLFIGLCESNVGYSLQLATGAGGQIEFAGRYIEVTP